VPSRKQLDQELSAGLDSCDVIAISITSRRLLPFPSKTLHPLDSSFF
jgi:hypothetical protein